MDIGEILKNMPALKNMMQQTNETMKNIKATGESAAGMVKVTVNGAHEITNLEIDDEMIKISEKAALINLIKGAHNVATKRVQERMQESLFNLANINPEQFNLKKWDIYE